MCIISTDLTEEWCARKFGYKFCNVAIAAFGLFSTVFTASPRRGSLAAMLIHARNLRGFSPLLPRNTAIRHPQSFRYTVALLLRCVDVAVEAALPAAAIERPPLAAPQFRSLGKYRRSTRTDSANVWVYTMGRLLLPTRRHKH